MLAVALPLMRDWNRFHPAVEWLLRPLGLPHVGGTTEPLKGRTRTTKLTWTLGADTHLGPVPSGQVIRTLDARESELGDSDTGD